jgi:hypothetical protein
MTWQKPPETSQIPFFLSKHSRHSPEKSQKGGAALSKKKFFISIIDLEANL